MEGLRQIYDKTRFTRKSYEKVTTKMYNTSISCRMTASSMHAVIILIIH